MSTTAERCPKCGGINAELMHQVKIKLIKWLSIIGIVGIAVYVFLYIFLMNH